MVPTALMLNLNLSFQVRTSETVTNANGGENKRYKRWSPSTEGDVHYAPAKYLLQENSWVEVLGEIGTCAALTNVPAYCVRFCCYIMSTLFGKLAGCAAQI